MSQFFQLLFVRIIDSGVGGYLPRIYSKKAQFTHVGISCGFEDQCCEGRITSRLYGESFLGGWMHSLDLLSIYRRGQAGSNVVQDQLHSYVFDSRGGEDRS